jgi:hypothetical protein
LQLLHSNCCHLYFFRVYIGTGCHFIPVFQHETFPSPEWGTW